MVEKFNRLQQTGSIEGYIDEFKDLRSLILQHNHILYDSYFLDSILLVGLSPQLSLLLGTLSQEL